MHPFIVTFRLDNGATDFVRVNAINMDGAQEAYLAACDEAGTPIYTIVSIRRG